jgi:Uma2 family endonuclease
MSTAYERFHFTVDHYQKMVESGILTEDDRVELIDGELITMSPVGPLHVACVIALSEALTLKLQGTATVSTQNPVRLSDDTEPLPDIAVLRRKKSRYRDALPTSRDVLIAIEVWDTTALYDRTVKIPRFGRAGIKESWLVDLKAQTIETFWGLRQGQYTKTATYRLGDQITSASVVGLTVLVKDVLE